MITVAAFSPALDLTYLVAELRVGEIHRPSSVVAVAGGKSLNMTRAAASLGANISAVALLGGPTGNAVRALLDAEAVCLTAIPSPTETRTCISIASELANDLTEFYPPAAEIPGPTWSHYCTILQDLLSSRPGWLSLNGSTPPKLGGKMIAKLIKMGHEQGVKVAVDINGPALSTAIASKPELVKINRSEAAELLAVRSTTDLATMATAIAERTQGVVVLTDGVEGAVAAAAGQLLRFAIPQVRGRFPVGSGDSVMGGILTALDGRSSLEVAIQLGMAAGIANAQVPGPGHFEVNFARQLARQVERLTEPTH